MKINDDFSNLEAFEKEIELKGFLVLWNEFQEQGANGHSYEGLKKWQAKFEPYGLTFDFGLDADPYDFELKTESENDSELLEEFEEGAQNRFRNNDFRSFEDWKEDKLN